MSIKVAIIEDTAEIAADLERILASDSEFVHAGTYGSAEAGIQKLPAVEADILICDIGLPGMNGIEALKILRAKLPRLKIVIFTVFEDAEYIVEAIQSGANGYLLKDTAPGLFLSELKVIMLGGATLTPRVAQKISQLVPAAGSEKVPEGILTGEADRNTQPHSAGFRLQRDRRRTRSERTHRAPPHREYLPAA